MATVYYNTVGCPDSISTKDLMEKTHQLPISIMIKERRLRWLGHAARRSGNNMVKQLLFATRIPGHVQPVGRPCGTSRAGTGCQACCHPRSEHLKAHPKLMSRPLPHLPPPVLHLRFWAKTLKIVQWRFAIQPRANMETLKIVYWRLFCCFSSLGNPPK